MIGKKTKSSVYLHWTTFSSMRRGAPVRVIYEYLKRTFQKETYGANIFKIDLKEPKYSFLWYPGFDTIAHPPLVRAFSIRRVGRRFETRVRVYSGNNPFILHRKNLFVDLSYRRYVLFGDLTLQEIRAGLLQGHNVRPLTPPPERTPGTKKEWEALLKAKHCTIRGHEVFYRGRPVRGWRWAKHAWGGDP